MDSSQQIRILTLNCWGLPDALTKTVYRKYKDPKISGGRQWPKRTERFQAIANKLDSFDVVCLQEVWIKKDQETLTTICKEKGLIYSHVFSSGLLGSSGLQIISRFPIKEVWYHKYRVNGKVYRVDHGDYHAGKGFGFVRLAVSTTKSMDVIVTHTIAKYNANDSYRADRLSQVWELIRFLQLISKPDRPVVIVGDMNCKPNSIEYAMFTKVGKLIDAYGEANNEFNKDITSPQSVTSLDVTPQRLDYVFFRKCKYFQLLESKVVLNDRSMIYSDHFGVSATFAFGNKATLAKETKQNQSNSFAEEKEEESDEKLQSTILEQCADLVMVGTKKAQKRKMNHLIRCFICMLLLWVLVSADCSFQYVGAITLVVILEFLLQFSL